METTDIADFSRWKEGDRDWAKRFVFVLTMKTGVPVGKVHEVVERTLATTLDSDLPAEKLFGDPDKAARLAASHETTHEDRSENRITPMSEAIGAGLMTVGFLLFVITWVITDYTTWNIEQTFNFLFVACFGCALSVGGVTTWSLISRGRIGAAITTGCIVLVGLGAIIFGFEDLFDATNQPSMPMYAGLLTSVVFFTGGLLSAIGGGWLSANRDAKTDTRDWFDQLEGYLRGQHAMTKGEATSVVNEARSHLAQIQDEHGSASDPEEEFGSARAYAQAYAGNSIKLIKRKAHLKIAFNVLILLVWLFILGGMALDGGSWWTWIFVAFGVLVFGLNARSNIADIKREENRLLRETSDE